MQQEYYLVLICSNHTTAMVSNVLPNMLLYVDTVRIAQHWL